MINDVKIDYRKWVKEIPFMDFGDGYLYKPTPPFAGAVTRFSLQSKATGESISVYFDAYKELGYMENPYWEIYPNEEDETERFVLGNEDEMVKRIKEILDNGRRSKELT